ncbi:efflux RND transporter periplasmic adaptor subunit [Flavobacterium sp. RSSA_27]|uniref:efflux RND transporter periplasmic adaptor subunit n=1 Tax=Flavobacterium sp. RSSA_27 TaxID=3447667 RepID=UPI003F3B39B8
MRTRFLIVVPFLSILLINCSKKESSEIHPTVSEITESVYASGVIKAKDQYTVFATVNGILKKTKVVVGQKIVKGQLLFELDSEKAELNTQNAILAYELSSKENIYIQDKIAEVELKVQMAKDKLLLDESVYQRNQRVLPYQIIAQVDYDRIEQSYKSSKSNYEIAKKQLEQLKIQLQNEQNKNAVNLKINQKNQSDYTVKSEFDGQLFDLPVKDGTFITTQTPIAIIGKNNDFLLELEVDENDMVRVRLGQYIVVAMDSYKGVVFDAIVSKIFPIMDERSRTFKIEARFVKPPTKLYPNLTAEANIIIQTKKNAITIPKEYLIEGTYVLVNKDEKRKVKVGLSDYKKVEILEGLHASETLYKPKE